MNSTAASILVRTPESRPTPAVHRSSGACSHVPPNPPFNGSSAVSPSSSSWAVSAEGAGSGAFPYVARGRLPQLRGRERLRDQAVPVRRRPPSPRRPRHRTVFTSSTPSSKKRERGVATLQTLDNESLVRTCGTLAFSRIAEHWASVIEEHIERSFLAPTEAILSAAQLAPSALSEATAHPEVETPEFEVVPPARGPEPPLPAPMPALHGNRGKSSSPSKWTAKPDLPRLSNRFPAGRRTPSPPRH